MWTPPICDSPFIRDRSGASSRRYRNCSENQIIVLVCEHKPPRSGMVFVPAQKLSCLVSTKPKAPFTEARRISHGPNLLLTRKISCSCSCGTCEMRRLNWDSYGLLYYLFIFQSPSKWPGEHSDLSDHCLNVHVGQPVSYPRNLVSANFYSSEDPSHHSISQCHPHTTGLVLCNRFSLYCCPGY